MARLFGRDWTRAELTRRVGDMDQLAGVTLYEHVDGPARGVRALLVRAGDGLAFDVLADRGMDIGMAEWRGRPLAWRSPTGNVAPGLYEPQGIGWLRGFHGGLLTTCGLRNTGIPSDDEGEHHGLHGRISYAPAARVAYGADWEGDEYLLWCEGQLREARLFGENLRLTRRITTRLGADSLTIEDRLENLGFAPEGVMLCYHINPGWPVVSAESELLVASERVDARDSRSEEGLGDVGRFGDPTPGFVEQVYRHTPRTDASGAATVALVNRAFDGGRGFGVVIRFNTRELPWFWQWKQLGEGAYVVGLEPNNGHWFGRSAARAEGLLQMLEPGETRRFRVEIGALDGAAAIAAVEREAPG
jgi:uncharacterized protein DUF4432